MKKLLFAIAVLFCFSVSYSQFGDLGDKLLKKDPLSMLTKKTPITTSLADVKMEGALEPSFGKDSVYKDLMVLNRTSGGGFILQPGMFEFHDQSYCLHAGTHGPGGGDGYMYAPPKGPMDEI